MKRVLPLLLVSSMLICTSLRTSGAQPVAISDQEVRISAGILERGISLANGNLSTTHLCVRNPVETQDFASLLAGPASELSLTVTRAELNAMPKGLKSGEGGSIDSVKTFQPGQRVDPGTYDDASLGQTTRWVEPVRIRASRWADSFTLAAPQVSAPGPDVSRLTILAHARKESVLDGLAITVVYEVYRGTSASWASGCRAMHRSGSPGPVSVQTSMT